jgi:hypothetical protein
MRFIECALEVRAQFFFPGAATARPFGNDLGSSIYT